MGNNRHGGRGRQGSSTNSKEPSTPPRDIPFKLPQPLRVQQEATAQDNEQYREEKGSREAQLATAQKLNKISIGAGIIAFASLVAVFVTILQSRDVFQKGQRAWVGVDENRDVFGMGQSGHVMWDLRYKNYGNFPTFHVTFHSRYIEANPLTEKDRILRQLGSLDPYKEEGGTLFQGQEISNSGGSLQNYSALEIQQIQTGLRSIVVIGKATYVDTFGRRHYSSTCLYYMPTPSPRKNWADYDLWLRI